MPYLKKPANKETICEMNGNEERDSLNKSILPNWAGNADLPKDQNHIPVPKTKKSQATRFWNMDRPVHKESQYRESLVEGSGNEAFH